MAFADTEATKGSIGCYNAVVLSKDAAHNAITLAGGLTISGDTPAGIPGTAVAGSAIVAGDKLQLCIDLLKAESPNSGTYAGLLNDITANYDIAGYFTISTPAVNG